MKEMISKMQLIENTSDLTDLCQRLNAEDFICVDLEFLREHSYFAKLCLIQIASVSESAIIDPLADIDLQPFFELMQNPKVIKVFHSGRQDIEIIYNLSKQIPSPLFDTQIAAQAAGFGESPSYESLVSHILRIALDKSSRLSDWSKRPLSESQINYALSDVTHLVKVYQHLTDWLAQKKRSNWIKEEMQTLSNEELYKITPQEVWQRMHPRLHTPAFLTLLRELAAWRENRAILKNVPRHSFLKDDVLQNICALCPSTKEELIGIRGMRPDIARGKIGDEIMEIVQSFKQMDEKDYVTHCVIKDVPCVNNALLELLKMLLRIIAAEQKIIPRMLAGETDLKLFCHSAEADVPFMKGWRYDIFGCEAEKLCRGETAIIYNPKKHKIELITPLK